MFINFDVKPNSDILVVMDYPSVNDSKKGTIVDGNAKDYVYKALRSQGIDCSWMSWMTMLPYAIGNAKVEDFLRTKKRDIQMADTLYFSHTPFHFQPSMARPFEEFEMILQEANPKYIVCMSSLLLAYMGFGTSIDAWRGSMLQWRGINVLVTFSPLMLYKSPERHMPFKRDIVRLKTPSFKMPHYDLTVLRDQSHLDFGLEVLKHVLVMIESAETRFLLAADIETRLGTITFISFAWSNRAGIVIPFIDKDGRSFWTVEQELELVKLCRKLLSHPKVSITGQNFQYDTQYIVKLWGVLPRIAFDTMVEAHALMTKGQALTLAFLASLYCDWYRYWKEDGKGLHKSFNSQADWDQYALYSGYDSCSTYEVANALIHVHQKVGDTEVIEFQRKMQNIVIKPVLRGHVFDRKEQQRLRKHYGDIIAQYQAWFLWLVPQERIHAKGNVYWFDSPTQTSFFFYTQLGIEPVISKKTKNPTADDEALNIVAKREPVVAILCKVLQTYRSLTQFYDLYLAASPSDDGRMRTQYLLAGTDTFRLASKKDAFDQGMNLQNLAKG